MAATVDEMRLKPRQTCTARALFEFELRRYAKYLKSIPLGELEALVKVGRAIRAGGWADILPAEEQIYERHKLIQDSFSTEIIAEFNRRKAKKSER